MDLAVGAGDDDEVSVPKFINLKTGRREFAPAQLTALIEDLVETLSASRIVEQIVLAKTCIQRAGKRLASSNQSSPPPSAIAMIIFIFLSRVFMNVSLDDLFHISNLDKDIF